MFGWHYHLKLKFKTYFPQLVEARYLSLISVSAATVGYPSEDNHP
jgi:hypothetical protein